VPEQRNSGPGGRPTGRGSNPRHELPGGVVISGATAREIAASVEAAVGAGALAPGARLPSVRALAASLQVSPTTVAGAFAELRRRGMAISRPRSGLRVADRPPLASGFERPEVPEGVRDVSTGNPDGRLLPDVLRRFRELDGPPRLYGARAVVPELHDVAAAALSADGVDPAHLCVVNGALDGVERVLAVHLSGGDAVAVEDPGFPGVLDLVRPFGLHPIPVPVDERGMRPDDLAAAVRAGARAVILTPRGQNPTGAALDAGRVRELRAVLDRAPNVLVIEDDHLGPVAGAPARTLTTGRARWAAVRSTSKWLGPDLRLAVLAGDEHTIRRVEGRQAIGPGWVSTMTQRVVAALWSDEDVLAGAAQAATIYAGRRRALIEALAAHGIAATAPSGLNVWVPVDAEDVAGAGLLARGWAVAAGSRFRLRTGPAVRVTAADLRPGEAERLAGDLADVLRPAGRTRAA
jgi:DNA-binding transcriptional MocR family regulator